MAHKSERKDVSEVHSELDQHPKVEVKQNEGINNSAFYIVTRCIICIEMNKTSE